MVPVDCSCAKTSAPPLSKGLNNSNGKLDDGEVSTVTDPSGTFALIGGTGQLIAFGGTDISTGLPFKGQLAAPEGSTAVTPLTTLLAAGENQDKLLTALGLPAGIDLTILDPIAALQAGDATGAAVYVAGAKVMDTVIAVAAALAGLGGNAAIAEQDAFAAITAAVDNLGAGAVLDLDNASTIAGLFTSVAQHQSINVSQFSSEL